MDFDKIIHEVRNLPGLSNENKLLFYGYFKQATVGPCKEGSPWFDPVGQAKHAAWKKLGSMTKDEAKAAYCRLYHDLKK